jgi:cullin-associated NEDD8-dissociated protein 1
MDISLKYISYDPNYNYDDDDENDETMDDSNDLYDNGDEEKYFISN